MAVQTITHHIDNREEALYISSPQDSVAYPPSTQREAPQHLKR